MYPHVGFSPAIRTTRCRISARTPPRLLRLPLYVPLRATSCLCHRSKGIGGDNRRDVAQGLPTSPVGSYGESPPVLVREPQSSPTDPSPKEAILFDQVGERLPLPAIEPAGDGEEQQTKGRHVDHGSELYHMVAEKPLKCVDPEVGQYEAGTWVDGKTMASASKQICLKSRLRLLYGTSPAGQRSAQRFVVTIQEERSRK